MKTINLRSEQFKQNLYTLINNSNLPIANVYYIFQLVNQDIENTYYKNLEQEAKKAQEEEKETEEKNEQKEQ